MSQPPPPPRKRLGQHFLVDHNIARKIVALAALQPEETVLEIGPGRGVLTRALCERAARVIAVEVDPALHRHLADALADRPSLALHLGDALDFDFHGLPPGTVVVANLPYYLSTPLLFDLLEARQRISRMVLMVQTEVARRIVAGPGTPAYGVLSVLVQCWTEPALAFRVPRTCFRPSPAVESAVLLLRTRAEAAVALSDEQQLVRTVRAAFAHRRKTVSNSLRDEGWSPDDVSRALATAGIEAGRRAETLSLPEFAALAKGLSPARRRRGKP